MQEATKERDVFDRPPDDGGRVDDTEADAYTGVKTVEAAEKVYGKYSKWLLYLGLGLASYVYTLDSCTTSIYISYVASSFEEHSLLSSIEIAQTVIISAGQPVIAKFADVTTRGTTYPVVLVFYVVGYIVVASARNLGAVGAGLVLSSIGNTGLQLLTAIIVADTTTLKWRGLVNALMSVPYIINGFIGSIVSSQVMENSTWRWGYGMFTILVPVSLAPLVFTLFWAERKARRLGLVEKASSRSEEHQASSARVRRSLPALVWHWVQAFDLMGLVLVVVAVALILVPLTLSSTASHGWHNGSLIAMLVVGIVLLFVFAAWEVWVAKQPVVPLRFLTNRTFVGGTWMCFFDFMATNLTTTYLYSWVIIVKPWSMVNVGYFSATQNVAMCVFSVVVGAYMRYHRRYKWMCFAGLCIHLLGVGLMIHTRGEQSSDAEIVWAQLLQGIGSAFASTASQVGVQASVPHVDVATITAVVCLWSGIGGACGNAIAGAIWTVMMPTKLAKYLPELSADELAELYGSITEVMMYPIGDPTRQGVSYAYDDVMKIICIVATCLSVLPLIFNLFMKDYYLGDKQNAVDELDLRGELSDSSSGLSMTGSQDKEATKN